MIGFINEIMELCLFCDMDGYGIYIVFIVVGYYVYKVSLLGYVEGIVWGMVFCVCIVVYKVCWI